MMNETETTKKKRYGEIISLLVNIEKAIKECARVCVGASECEPRGPCHRRQPKGMDKCEDENEQDKVKELSIFV